MEHTRLFAVLLLISVVTNTAFAVVCGHGWEDAGDVCYMFVGYRRVSWHDAKTWCELSGGSMATLRTWSELYFVKGFLSTRISNRQNYWIGGRRLGSTWYWDDGSLSGIGSVTDWKSGQPDNQHGRQSCLHMWSRFSYKWDDNECYDSLAYICEKR